MCTEIVVEDGSRNYPFYWTSTTHVEGVGNKAAYVAFGQAFGFMPRPDGTVSFQDVHGAGCQRSDPKTGDPAAYPTGFGPQGDVIRIYNYVRCVRDDG
jgi:streptogramin lyase